MNERRTGRQRRNPTRFLKSSKKVGRRLDDVEFSLFLKMGIFTAVVFTICFITAMFIG